MTKATSLFRRFYRFLIDKNILAPLVVAIAWQVLMTFMGIIIQKIGIEPSSGFPSLLSHTNHWDAGWFEAVLRGEYTDPGSAASVFYPLFPFCVWLVRTVSFGLLSVNVCGLIVNTLALAVAIWALFGIGKHLFGGKKAFWLVVVFLSFPAAFFMHMFYSEALFCAFGFLAYYFALKRKWLPMALSLAVLSASRITALLFIGLCFLEFWRSYGWKIKKVFNPKILYFGLSFLGFVVFGVYLQVVRGDFFGMFNGYSLTSDWVYHTTNPNIFETIQKVFLEMDGAYVAYSGLSTLQFVNLLLPIVCLLVVLIGSIYAIIGMKAKNGERVGVPLGVFGLVSIVFLTMNSNVVSVHRYALPILTAYIAFIHMVFRSKKADGESRVSLGAVLFVCMGSCMLQAYLMYLFTHGQFAG